MKILTTLALMFCATTAVAQNCVAPSDNFIAWDCAPSGHVSIHVVPDDGNIWDRRPTPKLAVTGTYSSADRFGIEGLAIRNGNIISRRYKSWDGILLINRGKPHIFNSTSVRLSGRKFNLKNSTSRDAFIALAKRKSIDLIQSHLLINNGRIDVRDQPNQPKFKRRLLVQTDAGFGVYETDRPKTLFETARDMAALFDPQMALNLDMGAYDYCMKGAANCGKLFVDAEKLTNFVIFETDTETK
ncbi:hypothetical protein GCM10008927_28330 [Amylibacter ulvae]|uniref:Phosphodiester glycosidase domain-containing protein n=1 Tax=Paramylibacter ulvae TaxID=1651968 RepID=A0ABQ3DCN2_9RHOB|nr:hypothetical protein [Amylibacter ulvae]GHA61219.1 hypothetical protein GCM10008927_28330 [Amylibacter ulvae]